MRVWWAGAWTNDVLEDEVVRAKTASWRAHNERIKTYNSQTSVRAACLDAWGENMIGVSNATYKAWRLKVDATSPARGGIGSDGAALSHATSFWPSNSMHRTSPPPSPVPPRSARPGSARRSLTPSPSPMSAR